MNVQLRGAEERRVARALLRALFETVVAKTATRVQIVRRSLRTLSVVAARGAERAVEVTLCRTAHCQSAGGGAVVCDGFVLSAVQRRVSTPRAGKCVLKG